MQPLVLPAHPNDNMLSFSTFYSRTRSAETLGKLVLMS